MSWLLVEVWGAKGDKKCCVGSRVEGQEGGREGGGGRGGKRGGGEIARGERELGRERENYGERDN